MRVTGAGSPQQMVVATLNNLVTGAFRQAVRRFCLLEGSTVVPDCRSYRSISMTQSGLPLLPGHSRRLNSAPWCIQELATA